MGWSDVGAYGGEIRTPNIDRLAAEGIRFMQFCNGVRCVRTRAALLTGRYAHQVGLGHMNADWGAPGYRGDLNTLSLTMAEAMRDAGYRTYMSGKWHVCNRIGHWTGQPELRSIRNWPARRGFDRFFGTIIDREALFREHEGNRAVRQGRWKAVAAHEGAWELHDIEADRTELHDLAAQEPERLESSSPCTSGGRSEPPSCPGPRDSTPVADLRASA